MDEGSHKQDKPHRTGPKTAMLSATDAIPRATRPEEVFYIAVSYRWSAEQLFRILPKVRGPASGSGLILSLHPSAIPGFILECISIEIFLKCLLQLETNSAATRQGHHLKELFDQLSKGTQDRIRREYNSREKPTHDATTWDFDDVLSTLSRAFVTWRYPYEYGMGATTFCTALAISFQTVILELQPDWKQYIQFRASREFIATHGPDPSQHRLPEQSNAKRSDEKGP